MDFGDKNSDPDRNFAHDFLSIALIVYGEESMLYSPTFFFKLREDTSFLNILRIFLYRI
jgi:hypothetical protein